MVSSALNATIGSAIVGLGSLLPSQGAFLGSTSLPSSRLQQEKLRRTSVLSSTSCSLEIGVEAVAGPVTGLASSPPRTSQYVSTRRVLAPTHCLSKARRGRRRPGSGDNDEQDDDYGNGGGDDGSGGSGGDFGGGDWWDGEDQHGKHMFESMWLWQALCLCSFLQAAHYVATGSKSSEASQVGALASLTHSFYNSGHRRPSCHA